LKVVCAYCNADLGEKGPPEDDRVTHGVCRACKEREEADFRRMRLEGCAGLFLVSCNKQVCSRCGAGKGCCDDVDGIF